MHKVYIPSGNFHIERQLPKASLFRIDGCEFVFNPNQQYDYFVTIDSLIEKCECKVNKDHRLLFLGEPPFIKQYNNQFIRQYGHIYTCQKNMILNGEAILSFPLLPWMLGIGLKENSHSTLDGTSFLSYDDFNSFKENPDRKEKACLITSNKTITKGHRDRVRFANYVLNHCRDTIDVYGNGYNSIPDKLEVLRQYKYAIVIENCQYDDYWTEKIGDCFLAGCYPVYHGCPNANDYFPEGSFTNVNICNIKNAIDIIRNVISSNMFEKSQKELKFAKQMILDKYNIFPQIAKCVLEIEKNRDSSNIDKEVNILYPMKYSLMDKIRQIFAWKFNVII